MKKTQSLKNIILYLQHREDNLLPGFYYFSPISLDPLSLPPLACPSKLYSMSGKWAHLTGQSGSWGGGLCKLQSSGRKPKMCGVRSVFLNIKHRCYWKILQYIEPLKEFLTGCKRLTHPTDNYINDGNNSPIKYSRYRWALQCLSRF